METSSPAEPVKSRVRGRLISLVLIGLMVIGSAVVWRHYRYARPVGNGPAGPSVPHAPFASTWSDRPVVLLGLGDSVTQGLGASPGLMYFRRLTKNWYWDNLEDPNDRGYDAIRRLILIEMCRVLPAKL